MFNLQLKPCLSSLAVNEMSKQGTKVISSLAQKHAVITLTTLLINTVTVTGRRQSKLLCHITHHCSVILHNMQYDNVRLLFFNVFFQCCEDTIV